ncbi:DUF4303 domain-containing protein [Corynebacterium mustelae]|nr:DUF4303 domain-containing protein [Corynebacterium mustelae]
MSATGIVADPELTAAIAEATWYAVTTLHEAHGSDFYQYSLCTTGEALRPYLSATKPGMDWWDLFDGPFALWGEEYMSKLHDVFDARWNPHRLDADYDAYCDARYRSMEETLKQLDSEGLFGTGEKRKKTLIGVLVVPPDATNTEQMIRLNPPGELLDRWLDECDES